MADQIPPVVQKPEKKNSFTDILGTIFSVGFLLALVYVVIANIYDGIKKFDYDKFVYEVGEFVVGIIFAVIIGFVIWFFWGAFSKEKK